MLIAFDTFFEARRQQRQKVELAPKDGISLGGLQIECVDCCGSTANVLLTLSHMSETDEVTSAHFLHRLDEHGNPSRRQRGSLSIAAPVSAWFSVEYFWCSVDMRTY